MHDDTRKKKLTLIFFVNQDVAAAAFLAYSAKPFSIASNVVQQMQSQDRQHIASVLGGMSMSVGACMCICLACYRMSEDADEAQEDAFVKKVRRSARILDSSSRKQSIKKERREGE